ncbi:MAG TPA: hypothetical protein VGL62_16950, partial [Vicinamibacterales bacterium]
MPGWDEFSGLNRGYVVELYDRFRADPSSVDAATRELFQQWMPPAEAEARPAIVETTSLATAVGAVNLAQSIRRYGHLAAQVDPLGGKPPGDPSLLAHTHGVTEDDLRRLPPTLIASPLAERAANMLEVIAALRRVYCSTAGYDYAHVFVPEERHWLRQSVETGRFRAPADPIDPVALLKQLTR